MSLLVLLEGGETSDSVQPKLTQARGQRSALSPILRMRHGRVEPWLRPRFVAKVEINSRLLSSRSMCQPFCEDTFRVRTVTIPCGAVRVGWFWKWGPPELKLTSALTVLTDPSEKAGPVQFFPFLLRLLTRFPAMANEGGTIYQFSIFFVFTAERLWWLVVQKAVTVCNG